MASAAPINRETVDLSAFPDLVVIYLGIKVRTLGGLATVAKIGPQINKAVAERPNGLLLHETLMFSLVPVHLGMRQYWRMPRCTGTSENISVSCSNRPLGRSATALLI